MKRKSVSVLAESIFKSLLEVKVEKTIKGDTQRSSNLHLTNVEKILEDNGFKREKTSFLQETSPGLFFISQPNGSQKFPDLLLVNVLRKRLKSGFKTKTLNFELKKGEKNCILWNDGFPRLDSLYLYSDLSGYNVLFTGSKISEKDRESYVKICEYLEEVKSKTKILKKDSVFDFFPRKVIKQKMNKDYTDSEEVKKMFLEFLKR